MTTTVIDSTDKKPANPQALMEYSREIVPMIKELLKRKELYADFIASNDTAIDLTVAIKEAQGQLKDYLSKDEYAVELSNKLADGVNDVKQAIAGAAKVCDYKPAELLAYFSARVKDSVSKVVDKGEVFSELERLLG